MYSKILTKDDMTFAECIQEGMVYEHSMDHFEMVKSCHELELICMQEEAMDFVALNPSLMLENMEMLSQLTSQTSVWTESYETFLEDAEEKANKIKEIKFKSESKILNFIMKLLIAPINLFITFLNFLIRQFSKENVKATKDKAVAQNRKIIKIPVSTWKKIVASRSKEEKDKIVNDIINTADTSASSSPVEPSTYTADTSASSSPVEPSTYTDDEKEYVKRLNVICDNPNVVQSIILDWRKSAITTIQMPEFLINDFAPMVADITAVIEFIDRVAKQDAKHKDAHKDATYKKHTATIRRLTEEIEKNALGSKEIAVELSDIEATLKKLNDNKAKITNSINSLNATVGAKGRELKSKIEPLQTNPNDIRVHGKLNNTGLSANAAGLLTDINNLCAKLNTATSKAINDLAKGKNDAMKSLKRTVSTQEALINAFIDRDVDDALNGRDRSNDGYVTIDDEFIKNRKKSS